MVSQPTMSQNTNNKQEITISPPDSNGLSISQPSNYSNIRGQSRVLTEVEVKSIEINRLKALLRRQDKIIEEQTIENGKLTDKLHEVESVVLDLTGKAIRIKNITRVGML